MKKLIKKLCQKICSISIIKKCCKRVNKKNLKYIIPVAVVLVLVVGVVIIKYCGCDGELKSNTAMIATLDTQIKADRKTRSQIVRKIKSNLIRVEEVQDSDLSDSAIDRILENLRKENRQLRRNRSQIVNKLKKDGKEKQQLMLKNQTLKKEKEKSIFNIF